MASGQAPETGTLVIAALLLLVLGFSGYWIIEYSNPDIGGAPWGLVKWFLVVAALIVVLGFLIFMRRGGGPDDR